MLGNCVEEAAGPPGTAATVTLAGATEGSVPWSNTFGTGTQVYYAITDGVQIEEGIGTYTFGPPSSLSRDTVLWNSAAGRNSPVRLNFSTQVWVSSELPAERAVWRNPAGDVDMAGRVVTNLAQGAAAGDSVRLDQLAWRPLGSQTMGSGVGQITFALPAGYARFLVTIEEFQASASGAMFLRFSNTGGSTWLQGSADYGQTVRFYGPSVPADGSGTTSNLTLSATTGYPLSGIVQLHADGQKRVRADIEGSIAGDGSQEFGCVLRGKCNVAGTVNAVQVGFASPIYAAAGRAHLLGIPA